MTSIIVVNFNTKELLRQCLASVRHHHPGAEVIVVDNASRDGSAEMVSDEFPDATLIVLSDNRGFAGANNVGIARSKGDFVVLLNSDTVLEDDGLARCIAWMAKSPRLGATSPLLIGVDNQPQECFRTFPSLYTQLREAIPLSRACQDSASDKVGWLAGTALVIRREALTQIGQLDEGFFMYWEDADFSARLFKAGWELAVYPDAYIRHYGGASGGGKDITRRPDLDAWYIYGRHRWFAKHRQSWEAIGLWLLDFLEVFRQGFRGLIRPNRRLDCVHARVLAGVLVRRLLGLAPRHPGEKN
jgi:GT2 family glycosyltransferase